jgi:thiamine kinase-like enzyme
VPGWEARARVIGTLSGGITNRNHLVEVDDDRFVIRLPGPDTELLEIDRDCELVAASRAADLGLAPEVVGLVEGCLVTRFVHGDPVTDSDFVTPSTLGTIAAMLRDVHATPPLPHVFDGFAVPRRHRDVARARGFAIPRAFAAADAVVRAIAAAFAAHPEPAVPCHNDLLRANFLRAGPRVWLLDWEYAGMNDRSFDLGNLAANNDLSDEAIVHLVHRYRHRARPDDVARVRLMRIVSDAREAMWGVVQQGISTIEFDYAEYAAEHFERLLVRATTPDYRADLALVGDR